MDRDASGGTLRPAGGHLDSLTSVGAYERRLRRIVRCLKFAQLPGLAGPLGDRLVGRLGPLAVQVDWVVPVPLHWTRRWRRGYNQSELLARRMAERLGRPVLAGALVRTRRTARQTMRSRQERRTNVAGAFVGGSPGVRGGRVLLVDDVVTTGATIQECARVLRSLGARAVHGAAAARTPSFNVWKR